jgi:hypothetical protein
MGLRAFGQEIDSGNSTGFYKGITTARRRMEAAEVWKPYALYKSV